MVNGSAREARGLLQRALAGDGTALAAIRRRLQDGLARSEASGTEGGDARVALLRGAYAAALDLLPRLTTTTQERR